MGDDLCFVGHVRINRAINPMCSCMDNDKCSNREKKDNCVHT